MTASKTLTTAVAAATIVGAISFAYAQTTDSSSTPTQGAPATEQKQNPTAAPGATTTDPSTTPQSSSPSPSMSSTPSSSSSTAPSSTDSSAAPSSEPAPKADRN